MHKTQNIEFDAFAPDTIEEILKARRLLEIWTARASSESEKLKNEDDLASLGRKLLSGKEEVINGMEILGENMENSRRKVKILKTYKAYHAYGDMLHNYAVKNLIAYMNTNHESPFSDMVKNLKGKRYNDWINLGGQIMRKDDLDTLRSDIGSGKLKTWNDIHRRYDKIWLKYPVDKQKHAFSVLCGLYETDDPKNDHWEAALDKAVKIQEFICNQVYITRKKDYDNKFRQATYRNMDEMKAAIGTVDENSFIIQVRQETEDFKKLAEAIQERV